MNLLDYLSQKRKLSYRGHMAWAIFCSIAVYCAVQFALPLIMFSTTIRNGFQSEPSLTFEVFQRIVGLAAALASVGIGMAPGYLAKEKSWFYGALPAIIISIVFLAGSIVVWAAPQLIYGGGLFITVEEMRKYAGRLVVSGLFFSIKMIALAAVGGMLGEYWRIKKYERQTSNS